jgi:hypothetical protein
MVTVMLMSMCAVPRGDGAMVDAQGRTFHFRDFRMIRRT